MPYPNWTNDERIKHGLTPYITKNGVVVTHIAWRGRCSGCGQNLLIREGIDKPDMALVMGSSYNVIESDFDKHPCRANQYKISRPYNPKIDMAHPMKDVRFISDDESGLFSAGRR